MIKNSFSPIPSDQIEEYVRRIYSGEPGLRDEGCGRASNYYLEKNIPIEKIISVFRFNSILDYGCGMSTVTENLKKIFPNIVYTKYDPYVDQYSQYPTGQYDFVMCNLVLSMLRGDELVHTIQELHRLSLSYVFVCVNTKNLESARTL